ncbi:WD40 repeat-like protein [Phanerochaete sordida]|uniref:WD40 repeat-like protein n=1 Tax=Phanerochaete sordida TaxID=48140 RepID=A0A9P3L7V1_9APHY|nr:WD40 repeat-like protein [Phanerochaete sordida]
MDAFRSLSEVPLSYERSLRIKRTLLSTSIAQPLDRVNVLGDESTGHTGCVNALSWAQGGEVLLTGGDDTTVRIWRIDPANDSQEYPFVCDAVIRTGHRGNIFNNQLLPHSSRIASVARDGQVRISDVADAMDHSVSGREVVYTPRQTNVRVLRCHDDSVKRIITEDSPDLFLTVSEDGSVRQHDLRMHHVCMEGQCPEPLVQMKHSLSTISLSPLTPYQFVVAGESPYGYLFDRRHSVRHLRYEWGMSLEEDSATTCVRRFGRDSPRRNGRRGMEHITGCRMASSNGNEVLLSYSSDAVYLYSTQDDAELKPKDETLLRPNKRMRPSTPPREASISEPSGSSIAGSSISDAMMEEDIDRFLDEAVEVEEDDEIQVESRSLHFDSDGDEDEDDEDGGTTRDLIFYPDVPVVMPRRRFAGQCNVETVKDVNFLGPEDQFVVSGSDDGHWFMWEKSTGRLHDILEGDGSVVNVIEGHPNLPLVAVSGIDTTVKLFAPAHGPRSFSRLHNSDSIIQRNTEAASSPAGMASLRFVEYAQLARRMGLDTGDECVNQ